MSAQFDALRVALSKNRAHEFDRDVWKQFVVPPYFSKLDLHTAHKPRVLIGGRGCGKTMLLRYFAHESMFSALRTDVTRDAISQVGLYWRTDTQFCNAMMGRSLALEVWGSAFGHYLALTLTIEFLEALESIANSNVGVVPIDKAVEFDFSQLSAFDSDLKNELRARLWRFETWVNNVRKVPEPLFLPGVKFVIAAIQIVKGSSLADFSKLSCYVYVDEYENLCDYQQRTVNTCLKHSEPPLVFHVAIKRNAFADRSTVGPESVSDIHDFREHDLEMYLLEQEDTFPVFAAEILLLSLDESGFPVPINTSLLRDPASLEARRSPAYTHQVRAYVERLFPGMSAEELAKDVFEDKTLFSILEDRIARALAKRGSRIEVRRFLRRSQKMATIIVPALLSRPKLDPTEILRELESLERNQPNRFSGRANWIHNNFVGCYLQLFAPWSRICPLYAGFSTFVHLSRGNLRHFLELCYKSITRVWGDIAITAPRVDIRKQAEAARQASAGLLGEIHSFGRRGEQLHIFALRLGTLFILAHSRPSQSEPEQNHFAVTKGAEDLSANDRDVLKEALKWSVLFEEPTTKQKDPTQPDSVEYVLNPIYAPYFYLSYRKRRKLELSTSQLICLLRGPIAEYSQLMREFAKRWDIEDAGSTPVTLPLFAEE